MIVPIPRNGTREPGELFVPSQCAAPDDGPGPEPGPPCPAAGKPKPERDSSSSALVGRLSPVAIVAVLLLGILGVLTLGDFGQRDRLAARDAPAATDPDRQPAGDAQATDLGMAAVEVDVGTPVNLPGPGSRDWVAPGARSDGVLVRADRAEESIEFRAANTQPGRSGPFRLSWLEGALPYFRGDANGELGVRPGGWVEFVVRPQTTPTDLVVHLSGADAAVIATTTGETDRLVLSGSAAVVTVALPAGAPATVKVTPAGDRDIGVVTAELR